MALPCYNSYFEVDLDIIRRNYRSIRASLPEGVRLIPVLKGDAYGFGAVKVAHALSSEDGAALFGMAQVGEGVELRRSGIRSDILVMGAVPEQQLPLAVGYDLQLTVFRPDQAEAISREAQRQGKTVSIHLKIETGLNRIGVRGGEPLALLLEALKGLPCLSLQGAFTQFIDAETPGSPLAHRQFELYKAAAEQIRSAGFEIPLCHVCNSGASDWLREAYLGGVRIGRRLYMDALDPVLPRGAVGAVEEAGSWRTSIVDIHTVQPGDTVGYGGAFTAQRPTAVAVICIGYGDGLYTGFAPAHSPCLVGEREAPYIGICMDQSFLDVTDIPCAVGDEVTVFGHSSSGAFLSAQALAKTVGEEGVFFTDRLSKRVERRYINE